MRSQISRPIRSALAAAAVAVGVHLQALSALAATGPLPPQGKGVLDDKGEQAVAIDPGTGLFVDPGGFGYCRFVQVPAGSPHQQVIPLYSSAEWQSWRTTPPLGDTQAVCCRPALVSLCASATNPQSLPLPYTVLGQTGSVSADCIDGYGQHYPDSKSSLCGQTGSGVMADGLWGPISDSETIPPPPCTNDWEVSSVGSCSGTCGGGSGTQTVTMINYGTCGGSFSYQQGCVNNSTCGQAVTWQCAQYDCGFPNNYACDCGYGPYTASNPTPNCGSSDCNPWTSSPGWTGNCTPIAPWYGGDENTGAGCSLSPGDNLSGTCAVTYETWWCQ